MSYEPEELLGTKLRALYQRKKGRDLFDLSEALAHLGGLDTGKLIACFTRYVANDGLRITRAEFEKNLAEKIDDAAFVGDVSPLLATGVSFDPRSAFERVRDSLISRLPQGASRKAKRRGR